MGSRFAWYRKQAPQAASWEEWSVKKVGSVLLLFLWIAAPAIAQNSHRILSAGGVRVNANPEKDKLTVLHRLTALTYGPAQVIRIEVTTKVKIYFKFYRGATLLAEAQGTASPQMKAISNPAASFDTSQIWNPVQIRNIVSKITGAHPAETSGWTRVDYRYTVIAQAKFFPGVGAPTMTPEWGGQTVLYTLFP